ncbi:MFS transporter [Plantactinospora endophytica]|uniref:MFS transporter n=1 Tax=Plantactinospora endophytica TaxID=673535 RepID=A0ABQ4DWI0_9ACTN|nr:MFS transporter [Plantactinospora endophytica]
MRPDGSAPDRSPAPLGSRYWRLWTSAGLSNLADGTMRVALPLVAVGLTRSPLLIAGVAFAARLPWLLFALPAGALADRWDRRGTMLGANVVRALLLALLGAAVALDVDTIWALYAVAFAIGVAETSYDTSAQAILPQLVRRDHLPRANGRLYAAELTASEFVGPPLAGFLVAASITAAFAVPAALWVAAVLALLLMPGTFRVERDRTGGIRADILEGLRFVGRHRLLRTFAVMVGVANFAGSAILAVLVLYAVGPDSAMGLSAQAYGVLLTSVAAGSVLGSFVAERVSRRLGRARTLGLTVVGHVLMYGVPAVTTSPVLVGAAFLVGATGGTIWNVITVSLRQRITPDRLLGRANSVNRLVAWGTLPLGAAAGGLLAQFLGLRAVFALMALVQLGLLAGMAVVTDDRMDAAERDADQPGGTRRPMTERGNRRRDGEATPSTRTGSRR